MSFRWGIAGTGAIASGFAAALGRLPDAELVAVGSRQHQTADKFGERFAIPPRHRYGSYEELAADDDVDLVYVATPASHHHPHTLLFLQAGRGVLCEKPFAMDAAQAAEMVAAARAQRRFLMEAMWSRFLPAYVRIRELVAAGAIGTVLAVDGDFGFQLPATPGDRLFDPAQGGGALLDLGVYPISLASMLLGEPDQVSAVGELGETGVDEHVAILMGYRAGAVALAKASLRASLGCTGRISGTDGSIELPAMMHCPDGLVVRSPAGTEHLHLPATLDPAGIGEADTGSVKPHDRAGGGLHHQIRHVHEQLSAGHLDSDVMPLAESVSVLRTLDAVRAQIGLRYPTPDLAFLRPAGENSSAPGDVQKEEATQP
ncbi:Gfo/Idh/MocA family oxidoreductase [Frankia sp. CNm7]|uniref:Gfo/Idh/MocA family oxidoreductase n=1 Tax=Frankia nepalensis TaxID=1836974 RepID=A0A937R8F5_9ACTN|nr:Gfo/Idh/MocA family oxidoreductase [Frankia nepalensis]MBL7496347.1 Gfo/Idh/MocA family oxidoreductase [Frankia nepalensis]MBL7508456.1 Gfo/Idh/MocA family oxidoreductase [Frankia nepalensis]MBL7517986.1 Gfo/Idh/MocA family oxidoreductase [Frankia nepalensis]MBL7627588.1 Gfo/Idh/MocA family oxidoreductase [Frankia nepalensis]